MFEARETLADSEAHETALACLAAGIEAAHPERVVADAVALDGGILRVGDGRYDLAAYDEVVVVGGGKAADGVADALERVLGERLTAGVVVDTDPTDGGDSTVRTTGERQASPNTTAC